MCCPRGEFWSHEKYESCLLQLHQHDAKSPNSFPFKIDGSCSREAVADKQVLPTKIQPNVYVSSRIAPTTAAFFVETTFKWTHKRTSRERSKSERRSNSSNAVQISDAHGTRSSASLICPELRPRPPACYSCLRYPSCGTCRLKPPPWWTSLACLRTQGTEDAATSWPMTAGLQWGWRSSARPASHFPRCLQTPLAQKLQSPLRHFLQTTQQTGHERYMTPQRHKDEIERNFNSNLDFQSTSQYTFTDLKGLE